MIDISQKNGTIGPIIFSVAILPSSAPRRYLV